MLHISKKMLKQKENLSDLFIQLPLLGNLIKIKQTSILVFTGVIAYLISSQQTNISLINFLAFLIGIFLAISGSTLLNMYYDNDIDSQMARTMNRPIPNGMVRKSTVLVYGLIMCFSGIIIVSYDNILTSGIVFLGILIDIGFYTILLKRRTKYSILFGGIAGGLPAIAGRIAYTNNLDIIALLLGLLVITWVPIHVLTLALVPDNLEGYRNAHIPMWPVVSSINETCRIIAISAIFTTLAYLLCIMLIRIDLIFCLPVILLGFSLIIISLLNLAKPNQALAFKTFKIASIFLALAFLSFLFEIV